MRGRDGFSLVEVVVALTLLGVVLLGMSASTTGLNRAAAMASRSTAALGLVQERLAQVRMDPAYDLLEARYEETETSIEGFAGFARQTDIVAVLQEIDGRTLDYKRVTVSVEAPGMDAPLSRTVTIGRE